MAIQGVHFAPLDGGLGMSFREMNVRADLDGKRVTSEKMAESVPHVSNFGVETKLGTSEFQQNNQEVIDTAVEKVAEIMQRDDEYTEVSNFGDESHFSTSSFQELNATPAQQQAAQAYASFGW